MIPEVFIVDTLGPVHQVLGVCGQQQSPQEGEVTVDRVLYVHNSPGVLPENTRHYKISFRSAGTSMIFSKIFSR